MKHTITLSQLDMSITYSLKDDSPRGVKTVPATDLKIGDKIVIDNYFHEIIEEPEKEPARVSISKGNAKMGAIPSVSLPPVITCPKGAPCAAKCYAAKLCRIYPTVKKAYQNNLDILKNNELEYWQQVMNAAKTTRFFRFHVSGDIPDAHYFSFMCSVAETAPDTQFLAFTKQYEIINHAIDSGVNIPDNLKIIFSEWGNQKPYNPHNLPTAAVIFKGETPAENWIICGGNCAECATAGAGCWKLKKGETIAFYEH